MNQKQFSFIYMLENVFQFFPTREGQEAMLARVRDHLHPEGCFLFETRNPNSRNLLQVRHPEPRKLTMPDGGQQEEKTLRTALRYVFPQEMEALLFYNGFQIRACYGDWQQSPLTATSPAMIHVCQRRS